MALIKCPECHKEISNKAAACPHCGCPISPTEKNSSLPEPAKQQKKKNNTAVGCGCLFLIFLFGLLTVPLSSRHTHTTATSSYNDESDDPFHIMQLTDEQRSAMWKIFQSCGMGAIKDIRQVQKNDTQTSYHVDDDKHKTIVVWVNNEDKKVNAIYYNDYDIYLDGKVVTPLNELTASASSSANDNVISLAEYNQIESGMTYEQVCEIIGTKGSETASSSAGNVTVTIVSWTGNGSPGSNASITFTGNSVSGKAQIGLK